MIEKEKILEYHKGGIIGTELKKEVKNRDELSVAYTPGIAVVCEEIKKNPEKIYDYTNKRNSVAVITNGSAVLGLGNIGAEAGKPVMQGKAFLFKKFAGIDAIDVLIDTQDKDEFVKTVNLISKTYGGINLEDIKAPECFYIEEELKKNLNIPVFHDDQWGTAIVVCAGLLNALEIARKKIEDVKIVFSGAGAAGIACAKFLKKLGAKKIFMCDSKGVLYKGREMNEHKKEFAVDTEMRNLVDVIKDADVFIGVSCPNILNEKMLKSMAKNPIIFAMSNPVPEIDYETAKKTREDIIIATGRSDYPNQINNVLVFPFIFRGALDAGAKKISSKMMIFACRKIAEIARRKGLSRDYFIPDIFDRDLIEVAEEVKTAAES
ncbi:MAG: malic enzyme-like NAD(P)-binding protein [archaeon]